MIKTLIRALAVVLVFSFLTASADENCASKCAAAKAGACATAKKTADTKDTKASCCPSSAKAQTIGMTMNTDEIKTDDKAAQVTTQGAATATAVEPAKEEAKAVKASDATATAKAADATCPDVKGQSTLENFHNVLHKMHTAYKDKKYDEIRGLMPAMIEKSDPFKTYVCPMSGGKCSAECLKNFETKKTAFLTSIEGLNKACGTKDNAAVDAEFMKVHESYVTFASTCNPAAETSKEAPATETKKATETK